MQVGTVKRRVIKHKDCWLVIVSDPRVPPTNNLAELTLRPLVIMRKICFGNHSREGGTSLATIMSVKDTARRHGHNPLSVFYRLFTQPPDKVMRFIYKKRPQRNHKPELAISTQTLHVRTF